MDTNARNMKTVLACMVLMLLAASCTRFSSGTNAGPTEVAYEPLFSEEWSSIFARNMAAATAQDVDGDLRAFCTGINPSMRSIVITSEAAYKKMVSDMLQNGYMRYKEARPAANATFEIYTRACKGLFPESTEIDFTQKTLLGSYVGLGGCGSDDEFVRHVMRDDAHKKIIYSITEKTTGIDCKKLIQSMNFILVPVLPPDYTVEFTVPGTVGG